MGGKTSTSTSQVQIPPEVLARYNSVNATAQNVAQTPFQQYSTNPNAFVAPLDPTQQAGVQNTNAAAGMAQPYFQTGTGFALAGSQPINAQPLNTGAYMNPYLQTVLGSTEAMVNQQNQQAMSGQTGNAMSQGFFGGDRSGIAAAVLQGQQELAGGQLYSGIASDAYQQALQAAQQQQGVQLGAEQANRAALQQTGQSLAELGTGAQGAALSGAQAQLGAGQVEQQTQQAGLTALYNQFLQQQSYPFQTAQFLANIAEGTGALSGSTTSTTQPQSIFSDERLKEDMAPIGKGFDGANIYRFRYRGDPTTRIGMSAQEVERKHPEAVREHAGFKAVDYGRATDDAARTGFALAANDNDGEERRARQAGGMSGWGMYPEGPNPMVIQQLLESQAQMYGPYSGEGGPGLYGHSPNQIPHGGAGYVPAASLPVGQLQVAHPPPAPQGGLASDLHSAASLAGDAEDLKSDFHMGHEAVDWLKAPTQRQAIASDVAAAQQRETDAMGGRVPRQGGGGLWGGDHVTPGVLSPELQRQLAAARMREAQRRAVQVAAQTAARQRLLAHPTQMGGAGPVAPVGDFGANPTYTGRYHPAAAAPPHPYQMVGAGAGATSGGGPAFGGGNPNAGRWGTLGQLADSWQFGPPTNPAGPAGTTIAPVGTFGGPAAAPSSAQRAAQRAYQQRLFDAQMGPGAQVAHHMQQAHAHVSAAQDIASQAGPLSMPAALPENIPGTRPGVVAMNAGDTSNLQTGFSPANLTPYHEGFFQRAGDWLGGHFGSDAQRMAYDARGMTPDNSAPVIQSRAFANAPSVDDVVASASQREAPPPLQTEDTLARSGARAVTPINVDPTLDAPVTLAQGGFARARRQAGGGFDQSDPRSDDPYKPQGPGLNIPTAETQHAKLATAAPPGQSGGGLGSAIGMGADLASIAKFALPFFGVPVKTGGRVGYDDGGPVADPNIVSPDDDNATVQAKVAARQQARAASGVGDMVGLRELPPTAASAAPPPADPTAALTPRAPLHNADQTPAAAAAAAAPPPTPTPTKQPGFDPAVTDTSGGQGAPSPHHGLLGNLFHGVENLGRGVAGAAGYEGGGHWNIDKLMPLLSAIGTAGSVPTVHPLVALAAGLGGYGQAYMGQKQAEANLAKTDASTIETLNRTIPQAMQKYGTYMLGIDKTNMNSTRWIDGRPYHLELAPNMLEQAEGGPGGGGAAAPGLATPQSQQGGVGGANAPAVQAGPKNTFSRGGLQVDYEHGGAASFQPSSISDRVLASKLGGADLSGGKFAGMNNEMRIGMAGEGVQAEAKAADASAAQRQADLGAYQDMQRANRMLATSLNAAPQSGFATMGPGAIERTYLENVVNAVRKGLGMGPDPDITSATSPAEIAGKIQALNSMGLAHQSGMATEVQKMLQSVLPSIESGNIGAANEIIANQMVQTQRHLDQADFDSAYAKKYGTHLGADQAYLNETGTIYDSDAKQLLRSMTRPGEGKQSRAEALMASPSRRRDYEMGFKSGDRTVMGEGFGTSRYWFGQN